MRIKRYLLKDKNGSATVLDAVISIGISVGLIIIFFYSTNTLYTIQDEPGVDLEAKSVGLMETMIGSSGQSSSHYPEWQVEDPRILKILGLGTSQIIQWGILYINHLNETSIRDGPYPDSSSLGLDKTCFLAGTKIVMADESYKNIEDIEIGDMVKSYDEKNKKIVDRPVTNVFHHTPEEMSDYYLVINKQLSVTPNHEFFIDGEWIFADELVIGDKLFYPSSDYEVFSIEKIFERTYTYNFEVEGQHNYFVAMEPNNDLVQEEPKSVLVHNDEPGGGQQQYFWPPEACFEWDLEYIYQWDDITFDAGCSYPKQSGAIITGYRWDWDSNGEWDTEYLGWPTYNHPGYNREGEYYVTLEVIDSNLKTDTETKKVNVTEHFSIEEAWSVPAKDVYAGETVYFYCLLDGGLPPYEFSWTFGSGEGGIGPGPEYQNVTYVYDEPSTDEKMVWVHVDDSGTESRQKFFYLTVFPQGYEKPVANYEWFDTDGPYSGGTEICFNASSSTYDESGPVTFELHEVGDPNPLEPPQVDNPIFLHTFPNSSKRSIRLTITDDYGYSKSITKTVQPNNPDPIEAESKPWVLTGKEICPSTSERGTFSSYSGGYYVKYTDIWEDTYIFEIKGEANSEQPILNYSKIRKLKELGSSYEHLKNNLGLVSDQTLYNFQIKIEILNSNDPLSPYIYGASDEGAVAKESTTRQVLVYSGPTAVNVGDEDEPIWKIERHPEYLEAEITLSIFIGGKLPYE